MSTDALSLTKSLLSFQTVMGNERDCARMAGAMLQDWGYAVEHFEHAEGRTSVVARAGGAERPLCFTGHLDVVPLGSAKWRRDPFSGETDGDKLYGRGTSDMKSGVAAMLLAARAFSQKLSSTPGIVLVLTAAEEGGCIGSKALAAQKKLLGRAGALVVGEPTSNHPMVGHKGSLKFHAHFKGKSAHGSMPHLGDNAVYKAAKAVSKLENLEIDGSHKVMGKPTLNVGTFSGGSGVNLVPDEAKVGVDIRTVPGVDHDKLIARIKKLLGKDADLDVFSNLKPVWTEPDEEWMQRVFALCKPFLGKSPAVRTAPYMTDAANLLKAYAGAPTVVLGPGEAAQAHQTDEYCSVERIREAVAIYEALIADWIKK